MIQDNSYLLSHIYFIDNQKRFKTSPFAWTNPLSGYMLVVIPEGPQKTAQHFQLKLIKDPMSYVYIGANRQLRQEYLIKWLNKLYHN